MPRHSYTYKLLRRKMGEALQQYQMINNGDRIALGLSGGKDSWALLWLLNDLRRRAPIEFELFPIFIDPGFPNSPGPTIADHGRHMGFKVRVECTDGGIVAHSNVNKENPCFLCSRLRRKRLFEIADELKCRKLALGHNKDDLIETLFLNICYSGEIRTMLPAQPFFDGRLTVIRPLAYTDEDALRNFSLEMGWPVSENSCPSAGVSKRAQTKLLLKSLYRSNRKIKGNIFRAMRHVKRDYLLK